MAKVEGGGGGGNTGGAEIEARGGGRGGGGGKGRGGGGGGGGGVRSGVPPSTTITRERKLTRLSLSLSLSLTPGKAAVFSSLQTAVISEPCANLPNMSTTGEETAVKWKGGVQSLHMTCGKLRTVCKILKSPKIPTVYFTLHTTLSAALFSQTLLRVISVSVLVSMVFFLLISCEVENDSGRITSLITFPRLMLIQCRVKIEAV